VGRKKAAASAQGFRLRARLRRDKTARRGGPAFARCFLLRARLRRDKTARQAEDRRRRTEDRSQKSENRGQSHRALASDVDLVFVRSNARVLEIIL
jgi:hypothetical protein